MVKLILLFLLSTRITIQTFPYTSINIIITTTDIFKSFEKGLRLISSITTSRIFVEIYICASVSS